MERLRGLAFAALTVWATGACAQSPKPETYAVDAGRSDIHWRVYKAGAFARFGHNHVISVGGLTGFVKLEPDLGRSTWELEIPVAGLIVDSAELRARYGERFSSEPSVEDLAGTRNNMLGEQVLDGEHFPTIRVTGRGFAGEPGNATLEATVVMLGREIKLSVPARIEIDADELEVRGSFSVTHEQLGMKPFRVMMGALQVGETLDFTFDVRAHPSE